jgi:hypothetical protein
VVFSQGVQSQDFQMFLPDSLTIFHGFVKNFVHQALVSTKILSHNKIYEKFQTWNLEMMNFRQPFNGFADKSVTNILILTAIISNIIKKVQDSGKKWDTKRKSKIIISENRSLCQRYEARGLVLAS